MTVLFWTCAFVGLSIYSTCAVTAFHLVGLPSRRRHEATSAHLKRGDEACEYQSPPIDYIAGILWPVALVLLTSICVVRQVSRGPSSVGRRLAGVITHTSYSQSEREHRIAELEKELGL